VNALELAALANDLRRFIHEHVGADESAAMAQCMDVRDYIVNKMEAVIAES
jgi:hypothetical protein